MLDINISGFLKQHQLPQAYQALVEQWFSGLAEDIFLHHKSANKPVTVGINGAQGSGKSTLAALLKFVLQQQFKLNTVSLSLDDFYYTRQQRQTLAKDIHPLLATRGVPGTHDITLARKTITDLRQQRLPISIPRFNKASDDRYPNKLNDVITQPVDIIIFEGWCLGAQAQTEQELLSPINDLETEEDTDSRWRQYVNQQLT